MEYELLFFASLANEEKIESIKKDITEILKSLEGNPSGDFSDIGKRKLAYPIKHNTHAFYSFVRFDLEEKQNIPEIGRRLSLYDKIMRHIIVRADEIGKPMTYQEIKPKKELKEKKVITAKIKVPKAPPVETKAKAALEDLDEKLSEILEETPE